MDALGAEYLATTTTFVQPAAMLPALRRRADDAKVDIDDLRKATIAAVGAEEQDLQAIRRFSVGNVVMWILLAIVFYTIVGAIQDVGVQSIIDAISGASVPILILALIVGQSARFAGALSVSQATPIPVPYGRLTLLEYAITFVNLAVPSTAARVAVNIRFFQRNGLDKTMAIAVSGLDSVSGFVAQITLLIVIIGFGLGSLNLDINTSNVDFNGQLLLILVLVLAVGVGVVAFVPKFRDPVVVVIKTTWAKIGPLLSSPRRLISVVRSQPARAVAVLAHQLHDPGGVRTGRRLRRCRARQRVRGPVRRAHAGAGRCRGHRRPHSPPDTPPSASTAPVRWARRCAIESSRSTSRRASAISR